MATLADDPVELAKYLWFTGQPMRPSASVRAPCCKRRTSADAVLDVRHVVTLVGHGRRGDRPVDSDWLCDACRGRLLRSSRNGWTLPRLLRATGMPWNEVKVLRAKELVREATDVDPLVEYNRVIATLPDRDIPGTEIPPDGRRD